MIILLAFVFFFSFHKAEAGHCVGRFINPITDICWKCVFPLKISGVVVAKGNPDPKTSPSQPICFCKKGAVPKVGIPISFWEPARLVDVTRVPYCMVSLGGVQISNTGAKQHGHISNSRTGVGKEAFYHAHWYIYPIFYLLNILIDFGCSESGNYDIGYITELDPFWGNDEKAAILNPEGILFGNPIAQAACAADCVSSTAHLPMDSLFWCAGCLGSIYPFGGAVLGAYGGVQASSLIAARLIAKLHRQLMLKEHAGKKAMCSPHLQPLIKKSHYRLQMVYPIPQTDDCKTIGHTDTTWNAGREFPYKGSDFSYLVWRKRDCCLGAVG